MEGREDDYDRGSARDDDRERVEPYITALAPSYIEQVVHPAVLACSGVLLGNCSDAEAAAVRRSFDAATTVGGDGGRRPAWAVAATFCNIKQLFRRLRCSSGKPK